MLPTIISPYGILKGYWNNQKNKKHSLESHVLVNKKYLRASYEASYLIANAKKPFTIG